MPRKKQGMHKQDIKAALIKKSGKTLEQLSLDFGYSPRAVSYVLCRPWVPMQKKVAKYLHMAPEDIWPERYDSEGRALPIRDAYQSTPRKSSVKPQNEKAA